MLLITFIPIPTKFVGAGFPADVYIYNASDDIGAYDVNVRTRVHAHISTVHAYRPRRSRY